MSPLNRYLITVLVCVLAASLLAIQSATGVATHGITDMAKADSAEVARAVLKVLKPDLLRVLSAQAGGRPVPAGAGSWPAHLDEEIKELQGSGMTVRINLFDPHQLILFSTSAAAIGRAEAGNEGVRRALLGDPVTRVVDPQGNHWNDAFPHDRTVVENYLPVESSEGTIAGVLEVYSSSRAMAPNVQSSAHRLVLYGMLAFLVLLLALIWSAYRTGRSVERQRKATEDRGRALRELSSRVIQWEEEDKARVSEQLHEGVCQSLSAIKYLLESAHRFIRDFEKAPESRILDPVIPSLQAAIRDTQAIAMELRPSKLDEAGLIATIESLCRECHAAHAALKIEQRVALNESDIPDRLKPVILRVAQSMLGTAVHSQDTRGIGWSLSRRRGELQLWVQLTLGEATALESSARGANPSEPRDLDVICARVILSGGSCRCLRDAQAGKIVLLAAWPIDDASDDSQRLRAVKSALDVLARGRLAPHDAAQPS